MFPDRPPRLGLARSAALLSIPLAVPLAGCREMACGQGTHPVRQQDGSRECFADPVSDSAGPADTSGDTGVDPGAPTDPDYPLADCTRVKLGRDADGGKVLLDVRVYDHKGYILSQALDPDGTGDFTDYRWYDWSRKHTYETVTEEWGDDHDADFEYAFRYRDDGQLDTEERAYLVDGNEVWHLYGTDVYVDGFLSEVDWDYGDGILASRETATWDGLTVTVQWDYELDGVIDSAWTETFNGLAADGLPHGQIVAYTSDYPFDGLGDYAYTEEYDDEGHGIAYDETFYEDGIVSTSDRVEYALDEWGRYASGTVRYDDAHSASDYDLTYTYTCW